jgi:hypothetical protein
MKKERKKTGKEKTEKKRKLRKWTWKRENEENK